MAEQAIKTHHRDLAPSGAAIDRDHLARMTFGEQGLAREVLALFDRQAVALLAQMRSGDVAAPAHTLKGSASGIGAWGVVRAATTCERAAEGSPAERSLALDDLARAVDEARAAIADLLSVA